jgi:hypothetical protein
MSDLRPVREFIENRTSNLLVKVLAKKIAARRALKVEWVEYDPKGGDCRFAGLLTCDANGPVALSHVRQVVES